MQYFKYLLLTGNVDMFLQVKNSFVLKYSLKMTKDSRNMLEIVPWNDVWLLP